MSRVVLPVAVTGASGFIGGAFARTLLQRGETVRVLVRHDSNAFEGATLVSGDLHTPEALRTLCRGAGVVVHCAARMAKKDLSESQRVNIEGTRNLLEAAAVEGVRRVVFVSSISVYRGTERPDRTFTEQTEPFEHPKLNIYSKTKLVGETLVREFCREHRMEWVVVRPTNVYGPGCLPWGKKVERLVQRFHLRYGNIPFNFIHIDDAVDGLRLMCHDPAAANLDFNLGAEHVSLARFQQHVASNVGAWTLPLPTTLDAALRYTIDGVNVLRGEVRTTAYTMRSIYPCTRAREVLGFVPKHLIVDEGLPSAHLEPSSSEDLSQSIQQGEPSWLHPVGSGTSKSDCFKTSGRAVGTANFQHLQRIGEHRVRVGAGVTLETLLQFLGREGLALPTIGEWSGQTVAGALSTGSHGGSYVHGSLASSVRAVTLIDGCGVERSFHENDAEFQHLLPCFGVMGVFTSIDLVCEPTFSLVVERRASSFRDYLVELETNPTGYEFRASVWLPALDCVIDYAGRRGESTDSEPTKPREDRFHARAVVIDWLSRKLRLAADASKSLLLAPERLFPAREFRGPYDAMLAPIRGDAASILAKRRRNRTPPEGEYALPAARAIAFLQALDAQMRRTGQRPDRPIGIRPGAAEHGTLAATHGENSVWISLFLYPDNPLRRYVAEALDSSGARPHWGKCIFGQATHLHTLYPHWEDFCALRAKLDPHGRLLNSFAARLGLGNSSAQ